MQNKVEEICNLGIMKLHILRHAETDHFSSSGKDIDRKLTPYGIRQATALRNYFVNIDSIESVWCSAAARTKETCGIVLQESHPKPTFYLELHLASMQVLLQKIWSFESNSELLIIGHNFGISELINYFTDANISLETAEYACIKFNCDSWEETTGGGGIILDQYLPTVSP